MVLGANSDLVHVRTPTYRRPDALRRCLRSLQRQSWANWICDVYDDDPAASARDVVANMADGRFRWTQNSPQKFAAGNIDQCFSRINPQNADWFCILEDDNVLMPEFIAANMRVAREHNVRIVLRNQFAEYAHGTANASISDGGLQDARITAGVYQPSLLRLALIARGVVSNGGLFWSSHAESNLELGIGGDAGLQEFLRGLAIEEPLYVAMEPLATWAVNGVGSLRDLGTVPKPSLVVSKILRDVRRLVWSAATLADRQAFSSDDYFLFSPREKELGLISSGLSGGPKMLSSAERVIESARACFVSVFGQPDREVGLFLQRCLASQKRRDAEAERYSQSTSRMTTPPVK